MDYGDACASPTLFSNSVHNAAAGHISIMLGLDGPCLTVSQFEMSGPSGLLSAIQWLKEERVEQVLLGAVEEYCDVLVRYHGITMKKM
jgi:3-oxoacyl-[acyl-carrier-protein] synthase II